MHKRLFFSFVCLLLLAACGQVTDPLPQLLVEEHRLTAPPDLSTDQLVFRFAGGGEQILAKTAAYRDFRKQYEEYNRKALASFGYTLKDQPAPAGAGYFSIYRGDQLIAQDVMFMAPISINTSQTNFVGLPSLPDGSYLFTGDTFQPQSFGTTRAVYGYVGERLLSAALTDVSPGVSRLQVALADQTVYDTQFNNVSTYASFDGPWTYGNHWALVLLDSNPDAAHGPIPYERLILDGRDMNKIRGYEQSFQFAVLDGRPFYFFQKSGKIGISFAGQELAQDYDEIPHYQCCTSALLNPGKSMNMVWFFARRASRWYYVEAYVPSAP